MKKIFFDKNGNIIRTGDELIFDSGSIYRVIEKNRVMCLKCDSHKLPLFELNKLAISGILTSACQICKTGI